MKAITSRHNPLYRRLRDAIREHDAEIVIEGPKQVASAIAAGWRPLLVVQRSEEAVSFGSGIEGCLFSAELFDSLAGTRSPQSVLGLFQRPATTAAEILSRRDRVSVALDAVQDPGNLGTIVRLVAAFDAGGLLLLPGCADPYGPKAIRASAGAILGVAIASSTTTELLACGVPLFATSMTGAAVAPPAQDAVLVFGNEGAGVSAEILASAASIAIPMSGRVESLNVASSAAILLAQAFVLRDR